MGRTLLILLTGFAISFGILAYSKDRRMLDSVDRMVNRVEEYSAKNTASSGAYMALNQLYQNNSWRAGYSGAYLGTDSMSVLVEDNSDDASIPANYIRILSMSYNSDSADTTQVTAFDGAFQEFAVWAKDSVTGVVVRDSNDSSIDPSLLIANAPYMPKIDKTSLVDDAANQSHVETASTFYPYDGYPDTGNQNFFQSGMTPHVTYVQGDLYVQTDVTIYGIFIVEGNVTFESDGKIWGVLFMPNTGTIVQYGSPSGADARVRGGIVTWGEIDGGSDDIRVRSYPSYMRSFADFSTDNPSIRVIAWEQK